MALRADEIDLVRDRRLVEAWQAGDHEAFDDLYRRYFDRLRSFCQRRVGNAADAEELAQEAFVRAYQALPGLEGERRFYPWVTVIASRLCIDHHRRRSRVEPSDMVDPGSVDDGHDARISLQADLDNLDRAMQRLGDRHLEVLHLRERRGLSYHEIASELGVPHSTVEALLFRARRSLRRQFQLVSAERLAALPGIGWVVDRYARMRARAAHIGPDLCTLGGTLAAGAVTAVLVTLPAPSGPAPTTVTTTTAPWSSSALPFPDVAPIPPGETPPPSTTSSRPAADEALRPYVSAMDSREAAREASDMPIHVDLGDDRGIGVNPQPILDKASASTTLPERSQP